VVHLPFRQQGNKLLPDGLDDVRWQCGNGHAPFHREALATPRMIGCPVPALQVDQRRPSPRLQPTALTLTSSPTPANSNDKTILVGKLSTSSGSALTNETVTVWRSTNGGSSWTQDGYATYDSASGTYKANRSLTANTTYQVRFSRDDPYTASTSPSTLVYARAYLSQPAIRPRLFTRTTPSPPTGTWHPITQATRSSTSTASTLAVVLLHLPLGHRRC